MNNWINVDEALPEVGEYVYVFEDDNINPHDLFHGNLTNKTYILDKVYEERTYKPQRVGFAQLRYVDTNDDGYHRVPYWQKGTTPNGSSLGELKNVTHWMRLPEVPVELIEPEVGFDEIHNGCNHRFKKYRGLSFEVCCICAKTR